MFLSYDSEATKLGGYEIYVLAKLSSIQILYCMNRLCHPKASGRDVKERYASNRTHCGEISRNTIMQIETKRTENCGPSQFQISKCVILAPNFKSTTNKFQQLGHEHG